MDSFRHTLRIGALILVLFLVGHGALVAQTRWTTQEIARWQKQAQQVEIIRDRWGIPHVYGKTDADAVFGLLYVQCEDDFKRVEMNYIEKLGRMAEVKGESELYEDLLIRLVIDSTEAINDYKKAPLWLKKILNAYADGINFYLYTHPNIRPQLLQRFEPWYPLLWTDGSIGAISTADVTVRELQQFYGRKNDTRSSSRLRDTHEAGEILTGSNGFAFSPKITESGKAILYINPHVTFYFRPEVQVVSQEGLHAYGAVTWGQFFVYQGFNKHCGWMHTSSRADVSDSYLEKITQKGDRYFYEYEGKQRPVSEREIVIRVKTEQGTVARRFTTYATHHGPIMAQRDGQWISVRSNNRTMDMLIQSWQRTKATSFADYQKAMDIRQNTSNNTVYADAEGNIAYWHGNFMPRRDPRFDWEKPVDGSIAATDWKGLHTVAETVHLINPPNGWLQNCNATPYTVAGALSPKSTDYPRYMAPDGENFRGVNAVRVLQPPRKYTLDKVIAAGYDTYLSSFAILVPALVKAFETRVAPSDSLYPYLVGPVMVLKNWDFYSSEQSVATTLAVLWGERLLSELARVELSGGIENNQVNRAIEFAQSGSPERMLEALNEVLQRLQRDHGRWQVRWGEINRFQRISSDIDQAYSDAHPSLPVGFTSSAWGMLPSYTARPFGGSIKRYGVNGNSFVCAVEFGEKVVAKSLLAGGQSGDPNSPHFDDQALMYTQGKFKDVYFYREDVEKNAERTYRPGE